MSKWRHRIAAIITAGSVAGSAGPSLATMPNPSGPIAWTDHSKAIIVGVDLEPQHYATARIAPSEGGQVAVIWTCENGTQGSRNFGNYRLTFYAGDTPVSSSVHQCRLDRGFLTGHMKQEAAPQTINFADNFGQITHVVIQAFPLQAVMPALGPVGPARPGLPPYTPGRPASESANPSF
jgi:hypothetical protein